MILDGSGCKRVLSIPKIQISTDREAISLIITMNLSKNQRIIWICFIFREQLRHTFTKALSRDRVSYLRNKLDMINIYVPTWM